MMKNYLLLAFSLTAGATGTVAKKYYTDKSGTGIANKCIYMAASSFLAAACLALVGDLLRPSLFTALLAVVFGAITALQGIAMLMAMRLGPVSYSMMFSSFSTVVTALSGVLFFHESITPLKVAGILLMLISFVFAVERDKDKRKGNLSWLLLCIGVFLSTGSIGIMQKVHQTSPYKAELDTFLVLAFLVASAVCLCASVLLRRMGAAAGKSLYASMEKRQILLLALITAGGAICVAINNKLNLFLSGVLEASVFFPIANGGAVVLSTLAAFFLFGERLSLRRWIGLIVGILAVVLLCI